MNYSLQERNRIYPQELLNLEVGQFLGTTVKTISSNFSAYLSGTDFVDGEIVSFARGVDADSNYKRIVLEVEAILEGKTNPAADK